MGIIYVFGVVLVVACIISAVHKLFTPRHDDRRMCQVMTLHRRRKGDTPDEYYAKHGKDAWGSAK